MDSFQIRRRLPGARLVKDNVVQRSLASLSSSDLQVRPAHGGPRPATELLLQKNISGGALIPEADLGYHSKLLSSLPSNRANNKKLKGHQGPTGSGVGSRHGLQGRTKESTRQDEGDESRSGKAKRDQEQLDLNKAMSIKAFESR